MNRIIVIFFLFFSVLSQAQDVGAYSDNMGYFYVFDNGIKKKLEHQQVKRFQVGGRNLAYIDGAGNFKAYYNGNIKVLDQIQPSKFEVKPGLVAYQMANELRVFQEGRHLVLTKWCKEYQVIGDSLILFFDEQDFVYKVYYNFNVHELANDLGTLELEAFDTGDHVIAIKSIDNYLTAIYKNGLTDLIHLAELLSRKYGSNLLAYTATTPPMLSVYYQGNIYDLEEAFQPKEYKTGTDLVAWIDNTGSFKVFHQGNVTELSTFEPSFFMVKDSLVIYGEQGYLKVFFKGKVYELENYIPRQYKIDNNTIAYIDQNFNVKVFKAGEQSVIAYERVSSVRLNGNTIVYGVNDDRNFKVYFNGTTY